MGKPNRDQGSVGGPHLFNLFNNDLAIKDNDLTSVVKYADDTILQVSKNEIDLSQEVVLGHTIIPW